MTTCYQCQSEENLQECSHCQVLFICSSCEIFCDECDELCCISCAIEPCESVIDCNEEEEEEEEEEIEEDDFQCTQPVGSLVESSQNWFPDEMDAE